jgi:tetratricopeptide (TPR) repeat protein
LKTAIKRAEDKEKKAIIRKRERYQADIDLIEDNPDIFYLHLNLAYCKLNLSKYLEAIANFREARRYIIILPDKKREYAFIDHQIAISYRKLNRVDAYHEAMERAIKSDPDNPQYLKDLGLSYQFQQTEMSIFYLEKYLRLKPDQEKLNFTDKRENIYLILGGLYEKKERYLDTLKYYQKYLREMPGDGNIHFAAAFLAHKKTGNSAIALQHYQKALENLKPDEYKIKFQIQNLVGEIFYAEGEYHKAIQSFYDSRPHYQKIEEEVLNIHQKIDSIKEKMNQVKLDILRKHSRKAQDILERYSIELAGEKNREEKASQLREEYKMAKIEWQIAQSFERLGDLEKSVIHYRRAMGKGYNQTTLNLHIQKLERILKSKKK